MKKNNINFFAMVLVSFLMVFTACTLEQNIDAPVPGAGSGTGPNASVSRGIVTESCASITTAGVTLVLGIIPQISGGINYYCRFVDSRTQVVLFPDFFIAASITDSRKTVKMVSDDCLVGIFFQDKQDIYVIVVNAQTGTILKKLMLYGNVYRGSEYQMTILDYKLVLSCYYRHEPGDNWDNNPDFENWLKCQIFSLNTFPGEIKKVRASTILAYELNSCEDFPTTQNYSRYSLFRLTPFKNVNRALITWQREDRDNFLSVQGKILDLAQEKLKDNLFQFTYPIGVSYLSAIFTYENTAFVLSASDFYYVSGQYRYVPYSGRLLDIGTEMLFETIPVTVLVDDENTQYSLWNFNALQSESLITFTIKYLCWDKIEAYSYYLSQTRTFNFVTRSFN